MSNVILIESDSSVTVKLSNKGPPVDLAYRYIIEEGRHIAVRTNSIITHIFRQANQVADCLTRLGSQQEKEFIVTRNMPLAAREFVLVNCLTIY